MADLPYGEEDEAAFAQGFGFADVLRKPSRNAKEISAQDTRDGVPTLVEKLVALGEPRPAIVFIFKMAATAAEKTLQEKGFKTFRMPGPFELKEKADMAMLKLARTYVNGVLGSGVTP